MARREASWRVALERVLGMALVLGRRDARRKAVGFSGVGCLWVDGGGPEARSPRLVFGDVGLVLLSK